MHIFVHTNRERFFKLLKHDFFMVIPGNPKLIDHKNYIKYYDCDFIFKIEILTGDEKE